jgi:hypothetical protein
MYLHQKRTPITASGMKVYKHLSPQEIVLEDREDNTLAIYKRDEYAMRVVIVDGNEYSFARFPTDEEEAEWRSSREFLDGIRNDIVRDAETINSVGSSLSN